MVRKTIKQAWEAYGILNVPRETCNGHCLWYSVMLVRV